MLPQPNSHTPHQQGQTTPLNAAKYPLQHGDIIRLERSEITLKFLVRDGA
jgi:Cu/Ag efflux protein CusF